MLKIIVLTQLFIQNGHIVEVCINCSICVTKFIILQYEPREASKVIIVYNAISGVPQGFVLC